MSESPIMRKAWTAMVRAGAKIFRNNVGQGVSGKTKRLPEGTVIHVPGRTPFRAPAGTWLVFGGRVVRYGLCAGSPDLVGYLPMVITHDMVGRTLAVFVGAEAKDEHGTPSLEQIKFITVARADGAICFGFRSMGEALDKLRQLEVF